MYFAEMYLFNWVRHRAFMYIVSIVGRYIYFLCFAMREIAWIGRQLSNLGIIHIAQEDAQI